MSAAPMSWRCDLHGVITDGDCPKCDDDLIALTDESQRPSCHMCGRTLLEGESAWESDWTVIEADGARLETRYTCDGCAA